MLIQRQFEKLYTGHSEKPCVPLEEFCLLCALWSLSPNKLQMPRGPWAQPGQEELQEGQSRPQAFRSKQPQALPTATPQASLHPRPPSLGLLGRCVWHWPSWAHIPSGSGPGKEDKPFLRCCTPHLGTHLRKLWEGSSPKLLAPQGPPTWPPWARAPSWKKQRLSRPKLPSGGRPGG